MNVLLLIVCALVALAFSAFFSGTETAFLSVSRERILHLAKEGGHRARRIQKALSDMGCTTTTLLIGNNIANVSYSSATAALAVHFFSKDNSLGNFIWSFFAAFVVLYCSEFMPKLLCSARPLRRSLLLSLPYDVISAVLSPITSIALKLTNIFIPRKESVYKLSAADLVRILEDRKNGVCLSDIESALISRIIVLRIKNKKITTDSILDALRDQDI